MAYHKGIANCNNVGDLEIVGKYLYKIRCKRETEISMI
jgi:hypothetical protein